MKKNQLYPSDLTDRQWDCIKELIPAAKPGGRSAHPGDASGDQCDLVSCGDVDASGACCHESIRHGKVCTRTFSSGVMMEPGNESMTRFELRCVSERVAINIQRQGPWIAKASKRRRCLACAAMMVARR